MEFLDLFAGIGGIRLGLESQGHKCVGYVEKDKFARQSYQAVHNTENEWTKDDITTITNEEFAELKDKVSLIVGGFPCFAAGTLITTSEGLKNIEDVKKEDSVLTHKNRFKKVVVPMMKQKKGIYNLKILGSPINKVTEEHPYYVREMVRVKDKDTGKPVRTWSEPKWVNVKDLVPYKHYVGFSENKESKNPYNVSEEEAWLLGRYIADGYIQNGKRAGRKNSYNYKTVFCVGKDKVDYFETKVSEYHATKSENRTVYKMIITSERLMKLAMMCGRGSENKVFPSYILDLPKELLEIVMEGYLSGDGSVKDGLYSATTVSKYLAYSLGQAIQKVYKTHYTMTYTKRPKTCIIEGRTVNQRDTYRIQFTKEPKSKFSVYLDGMLWNPVTKKEYDDSWEGIVYNFEVEDDNSYVANNATVHNCQAFSISGKRLGFADDTRGTLFFDIMRAAKEIQPKVILMENVKGLVNHDGGNTLQTILSAIDEVGYNVEYEVLNSKYFGVPQNRERIFFVAVRKDLPFKPFLKDLKESHLTVDKHIVDILEKDFEDKYITIRETADDIVQQLKREHFTSTIEDRIVRLGHTGVTKHNSSMVVSKGGICPTVAARDFKGPRQIVDVKKDELVVRKLTPLEYWRIQGFEDVHFKRASEVVSKSQLYKQAGNSVSVPVIKAIAEQISKI